MDELNQFLNSVEASARRILKQQNKKQQELITKERAALVRAGKNGRDLTATSTSSSPATSITREQLKAKYSPGGALIVQAPTTPSSPVKSPGRRRSETELGEDTGFLPRLPQSPLGPDGAKATNANPVASHLPAIDTRKAPSKANALAKQQQAQSVTKAQREKRTAEKIMSSPLYKSLANQPQGFGGASSAQAIKKAIQDVDNINLLLKKLGLRDSASPSKRPDHAVEKRMCNACWASPNKFTGCEHHARVMPSNNNNIPPGLSDEAQMLRQMELQGPTSWLSDDLFVKYRSENDREKLWRAFCRLKEAEAEQERLGELVEVAVIPIVVRHPICDKYYTQIELENLKIQAETRKRNQTKMFIFDVNDIWLTNLDHFNARLIRTQRRKQRQMARLQARTDTVELDPSNYDTEPTANEGGDDESDDLNEQNALRDRRDEGAIREGYCQIQSISTSRALQNAIFPPFDPSISSFSIQRQSSSAASTIPAATTPASTTRRKRPLHQPFREPPLTLLVSGHWNPHESFDHSALSRVPGVAVIGTRRVLWWKYPHDDNDLEHTKVIAIFSRSKTLSSSNAILVMLMLALDSPLLSPLWFAWHIGSRAPPPQLYEKPHTSMQPPQYISPCKTSLLGSKLQTRIDTLLPGTIMALNPLPQPEDFVIYLDEPYSHRRFIPEFDPRDQFRQWWTLRMDVLAPYYDVDPQGCSVQVAQPNAAGLGGRFIWHSVDVIAHHLNRPRLEKDYVYIIENHLTCGSNGAMWFAVAMTHEVMKDVTASKLSEYLQMLDDRRKKQEYEAKLMEIEKKIEQGRLLLEAKRQEQERIEQELSAKAARAAERFETDKMTDAALTEWEDRLQYSVVTAEQVGWQRREITEDQSQVVFYYSLNDALPRSHRFSWEKPIIWPEDDEVSSSGSLTNRSDATSISGTSDDEDSDSALTEEQRRNQEMITQMANALLADEQFLLILKTKLGLDTDDQEKHKPKRKSMMPRDDDGDDDDVDQLDLHDCMIRMTEETDKSKASLMATKMAKLLQLPAKSVKTMPSKPGEGWKRLKVSKLPKTFARTVYSTHTESPRSAFINQTNNPTPVGMIDPRESSPYEAPDFIPELRVMLIPKPSADLQEKKLQWAEYLVIHPADPAQQVRSPSKTSLSAAQIAKDALFEKEPAESDMTMEQLVAKAILCARNNNLQGLEDALDGGCDVNARDNHGNSLFILVCQQGNKKMAKFLMRRHADMNLQNLNGNTALHYLIEYKHTDLADYIKSKGAIDTIQNAAGLTCYEGLSMDHVEAI